MENVYKMCTNSYTKMPNSKPSRELNLNPFQRRKKCIVPRRFAMECNMSWKRFKTHTNVVGENQLGTECEVTTNVAMLRATSHMRLRARDRYTSGTFIGGKSRAGPSSLHTTLEDQRSM
jgi:hypothetical protein